MTFRTRFAPSPTGYLHVGGARTALYCWLQARKERGVYVLRIEDTDLERSSSEAVDAILESLVWLGLKADEGPIFQTERFDRYDGVIGQLMDNGSAYRCYCSRERLEEMRDAQRQQGEKPRYDGRCRHREDQPEGEPFVIRFKSPQEGVTRFDDLVRGQVVFENSELDDLIIKRSDGSPTYNLTVVVDDADMNISHVIRGDDHINNTPRQITIFNALGLSLPVYAHVPMILGEDGSRLSKRHGAVGVMEYYKQGYLPEALLNYLIRLGWSHGDQEIFSIKEMTELFDVSQVNSSASTFNTEKLRWVNQQHMLVANPGRLAALMTEELSRRSLNRPSGVDLEKVAVAYRERAHTICEIIDQCEFLFQSEIEYDDNAARKHLRPVAVPPVEALLKRLSLLEQWTSNTIEQEIDVVLNQFELKLPKVALPVRVAVTGKATSPSIGVTLEFAGRTATLKRLDRALTFMRKRAANQR